MKLNWDSYLIAGALLALLGAGPAPAQPVHAPAGLSAADWASVRAEYERHRHALQPAENGFRGRNFGQSWTVELDGRGVAVEPDHGGWTWGLELVSYGYAGRAEAVAAPARVSGEVERVTYAWDARLEEWFVNESRGLEHGFTVRRAPDGEGGTLELNLRVRGDWTAAIDADGRGAGFARRGGGLALRYAGLKAWDADGRELAARLETAACGLRLAVDVHGARYPVTIDPLAQEAYVKASNTGTLDYFGWSVSLSGDTLAVGAYNEASNGTGVNPGAQANNSAPESGAVYVFRRVSGVWTQQAYIKASNTGASDRFGYSVSLSGDTLAVGAPSEDSNGTGVNSNSQANNAALESGAVYVFQRTGSAWAQQAYIKASNTEAFDFFGYSVTLSGDTLAVGAIQESSNGVGVNPNAQADNSLIGSGAVYVFQRSGAVWAQQAYVKASNPDEADFFGYSVALSGNTLAVGASQESSNGVGVNSNAQADNSFSASGAAYVFERTGTVWAQQAYIKASNTGAGDLFGSSVALSGNHLAVGAPSEAGGGMGVNPNAQGDNSASNSGAVYAFAGLTSSQGSAGSNVAVYRPGVWLADKNANGAFDPGTDLYFLFGFPGSTPIAGDWNGDGRQKAGLYANGFWYLDYDGNGVWDGGVVDKQYEFGFAGVKPFVGDWNGDGRDKIGIYINGFWFLDANGNGVWNGPGVDIQAEFGWNAVTPLVGDWNGDGRDKIGIFINGFWYLDYNGNARWDGPVTDREAHFGYDGVTPLTGDWNGDGRETIGFYTNGFWYLDANGNGVWNGPGVDIQAHFGFPGVTPLRRDWNGDGRDKMGLFINGQWYIDYDGSATWDGGIVDKAFTFGQAGDIPFVGPW